MSADDQSDHQLNIRGEATNPDLERSELRSQMRSLRRGIPMNEARDLSQLASERLSSELERRGHRRVALYFATDGELDPMDAGQRIRRSGGTTFLPVMLEESHTLRFAAFDDESGLTPSRLGTLEPLDSDHREAADLEVIVLPGVAFDRTGVRIGFGQGWYDRTLAGAHDTPGAPLTIGFCYDEQIVDEIPAHPWDKSVQMIVTPTATIICNE